MDSFAPAIAATKPDGPEKGMPLATDGAESAVVWTTVRRTTMGSALKRVRAALAEARAQRLAAVVDADDERAGILSLNVTKLSARLEALLNSSSEAMSLVELFYEHAAPAMADADEDLAALVRQRGKTANERGASRLRSCTDAAAAHLDALLQMTPGGPAMREARANAVATAATTNGAVPPSVAAARAAVSGDSGAKRARKD